MTPTSTPTATEPQPLKPTPTKPRRSSLPLPSWLLSSLHGYQGSYLSGDLIAAATLLAIAVPEQLATSRLAGMPPITGIYAFICGSIMFALLGASAKLSVGADSTIAPLFAAAIATMTTLGSTKYVAYVGILAVMVGVFVALVWLLRLGWIAEFLSAPIITGFLAGIGVVIIVHQLPDLLGVAGGGSTTLQRLHKVSGQLGHINYWTLGIGLAVFVVVVVLEKVSRRLPAALIALVLSTLAVAIFKLHNHGVKILGHIAHGAPKLGLHQLSFHAIGQLAPAAAVVALVVVIQTAASSRAFAPEGTEPDVGRDLLGAGAGSILAGLVGAFPVNTSPARSAAIGEAGGRTQVTSIAAAVVIIALIPAAGILHDVPLATLAGVLLFVATRVFHIGDLKAIARFNLFEFGLALVTLVVVALVGVEWGIGVAILLAIFDRTRISSQPHVHILGRIPNSTSWAPIGSQGATPVDGVLVLLFATSLWYANATHFQEQAMAALANPENSEPIHAVVLDTLGMTDVDYTAAAALKTVLDEVDRRHLQFAIARASRGVAQNLRQAELAPSRIPAANFFPSVNAAVETLTKTSGTKALNPSTPIKALPASSTP